ncbi:hypothetical protein [Streptomyces nymphaeiformis]|uniref:Uncharacterized protein n=1 Tax=Streptomyces nymphaeiformis TaxID=2663842 RepID=A0A7W7TTT0_9ACTN|nr:hypothetical protein [Streptomyces nymphaeiformis]MBB4979168.1 hypothetical protein [Streptomyces nymphaeiformis]
MRAELDGASYGMHGMSAEAVRYNSESMTQFKARIDGLIDKLKGSEAGKGKVPVDPVERGQFGGGGGEWSEAGGVYDAYNSVIRQLVDLSGLLQDCLEGLGIAVVASKDGFEQMDDETKRKMINIHQRTEDAKLKADKEAGRTAPPSQDSKTVQDPANGGSLE